MVILGIHDGHDSSVALSKDGEIVYASQEERFTNLKGDYGFPKNAIKDCLKSTNTKVKDIDQVALASKFTNPILMKIKRNAQFSVSDWIKEQELYWRPKIYQNKKVSYWNIFKKNKNFKQDNIYNNSVIMGDVDSNGSVNVLDIILAVTFIIDDIEPSTAQFNLIDLNQDNQINVLDIIDLINIILR